MGIIHTSLVGSLITRAPVLYTFAANASNQTVTLSGLSGYKANRTCVFITINPGVYIYSTSTATPALTITGGATGDRVKIVNQGYIMGMGGSGASGLSLAANGGNAISVSLPVTIDNTYSTAYIGGGGGGGAGFAAYTNANNGAGSGGGGAGGGAGGSAIYTNYPAGTGGAGGAIGQSGASAADTQQVSGNVAGGGKGGGAGGGGGAAATGSCSTGCALAGGGGGGRIFPGVGGAGGQHSGTCGGYGSYAGGSGNNVGVGSTTGQPISGAGGGAGWGASGGASSNAIYTCVGCNQILVGYNVQLGGTGGKAVELNAQSITWVNGCTARVYGSVS